MQPFEKFQQSRRYVDDLKNIPMIGDNFEYEKSPVPGYVYEDDMWYIQKTGDLFHTVLGRGEPQSKVLEDVEKELYMYTLNN